MLGDARALDLGAVAARVVDDRATCRWRASSSRARSTPTRAARRHRRVDRDRACYRRRSREHSPTHRPATRFAVLHAREDLLARDARRGDRDTVRRAQHSDRAGRRAEQAGHHHDQGSPGIGRRRKCAAASIKTNRRPSHRAAHRFRPRGMIAVGRRVAGLRAGRSRLRLQVARIWIVLSLSSGCRGQIRPTGPRSSRLRRRRRSLRA